MSHRHHARGDKLRRAARRAARLAGLAIAPEDFPRVAQFLRGYLHQDLLVEYGSPRAALDAFLLDLSSAERREFSLEAARLNHVLSTLPLAAAQRAFTEVFGAAWSPESLEDVRALLRISRE